MARETDKMESQRKTFTQRGKLLKISLLLGTLVFQVSCRAQQSMVPRSTIVYKSVQPLSIDGIADEESWKNVPYSRPFIDIEGVKVPTYRTRMKMLWDETYLYFYVQMEEPHVWGTLKQRDTVIFYNNDIEIFIDPDGDTHNYYEFEMNALGTVWDLFLVKPYREGGPVLDRWDILGLKSAVHVQGSLNDPSDRDQGWSVEVAMPWDVLVEASGSNVLPESKFWRINFSRVNWDFELEQGKYSRKRDADGKFLPEHNWVWSPQGVINMHEPEHWGYAYFSPNQAGNPDSFSIPKDEQIRWLFYKLYRAQKEHLRTHGQYAKDISALGIGTTLGDGSSIHAELENHKSGWTIEAESPFSGKRFQIREDGKTQEIKKMEQQ